MGASFAPSELRTAREGVGGEAVNSLTEGHVMFTLPLVMLQRYVLRKLFILLLWEAEKRA